MLHKEGYTFHIQVPLRVKHREQFEDPTRNKKTIQNNAFDIGVVVKPKINQSAISKKKSLQEAIMNSMGFTVDLGVCKTEKKYESLLERFKKVRRNCAIKEEIDNPELIFPLNAISHTLPFDDRRHDKYPRNTTKSVKNIW